MPILIAIFGLLAAGAIWWYRLKYMSDAAREVVDVAGRVRGNFRRSKLRKKAAMSPVTAIDDPVVAAATLMIAIAAEDRLVSDVLEKRVSDELAGIAASPEKAQEALIYAKWASDQVTDVPLAIDKIAEFLKPRLDETEKNDLVDMVKAATPAGERPPFFAQRIERLRRKLGLEVKP